MSRMYPISMPIPELEVNFKVDRFTYSECTVVGTA